VIGATNFAELLDKALMRPGRFDRHVSVNLPNMLGRKEIIELYLKKIKAGPDVQPAILARATPGCSGMLDTREGIDEAVVPSSRIWRGHSRNRAVRCVYKLISVVALVIIGADLYNLVNSAAVRASQLGHSAVSMQELEWAKDKILMGAERKGKFLKEEVTCT